MYSYSNPYLAAATAQAAQQQQQSVAPQAPGTGTLHQYTTGLYNNPPRQRPAGWPSGSYMGYKQTPQPPQQLVPAPAAHIDPYHPEAPAYSNWSSQTPAAAPAAKSTSGPAPTSSHYSPYMASTNYPSTESPATWTPAASSTNPVAAKSAAYDDRSYAPKRTQKDEDDHYSRPHKVSKTVVEEDYLYASGARGDDRRRELESRRAPSPGGARQRGYPEPDRGRRSPQRRSPPRRGQSPDDPVIPKLTREQNELLLKTLTNLQHDKVSRKEEETVTEKYDTCLYLALDDCPPEFKPIDKVLGDNGENLNYLRRACEARIELRGEGTNMARNKPLHIYIGHSTLKGMQEGEKLAASLVDVVQKEYKEWLEKRKGQKGSRPSMREKSPPVRNMRERTPPRRSPPRRSPPRRSPPRRRSPSPVRTAPKYPPSNAAPPSRYQAPPQQAAAAPLPTYTGYDQSYPQPLRPSQQSYPPTYPPTYPPRDPPRDPPRESHRDPPREIPREIPRESPRDHDDRNKSQWNNNLALKTTIRVEGSTRYVEDSTRPGHFQPPPPSHRRDRSRSRTPEWLRRKSPPRHHREVRSRSFSRSRSRSRSSSPYWPSGRPLRGRGRGRGRGIYAGSRDYPPRDRSRDRSRERSREQSRDRRRRSRSFSPRDDRGSRRHRESIRRESEIPLHEQRRDSYDRMPPGRDRDGRDRERPPPDHYRPDRRRSRSYERRPPAFRSSRPEERYPERDREYPDRDRDYQEKDRKYLDKEREKDKDRSRYVIDRRVPQPEGSKNAKNEAKSNNKNNDEKKPASEAGQKSGTEQDKQKTKDSSATDGKPETKAEATAVKSNSADMAEISESKGADAKGSVQEKDNKAAMGPAGEKQGGSKMAVDSVMKKNEAEKTMKTKVVSKTNEPTKSDPDTKEEAGKPGEKPKEVKTETKTDSKAQSGQTATKPEAKEQAPNKATAGGPAAKSGPTAAKPATDAAKPATNAAKTGATASAAEPGTKPTAAVRGRGRGRGVPAGRGRGRGAVTPTGRGRGASPAAGKTQPAAKPGAATPASKPVTPAQTGTKPGAKTPAKPPATAATSKPAAASAIKPFVPKPIVPKPPVGRGRGASPTVVVRGRGARGGITPVGRGRGRGRGGSDVEDTDSPGNDYQRMRALGLKGVALTRALDNNDWAAMGEVVVSQPRPDQCRRVWIFGDLQIYQAAQRADVYAMGPNLGISRFIQLVWIGIPGLLLIEAKAALRCFMDKNTHLEPPHMIIVQIGTEDVGARVNIEYAKDAVAGFLEFIRELLPYTRIIWSEVLMTVPMPTEMKNIVTSMNQMAGNMMEFSLQNAGYCENISQFYEKQHMWFRPSSMYINEQGSLAIIDRLKRYISAINMN